MARRRGNRAPYEIMGTVTRGAASAPVDEPEVSYEREYPSERRSGIWWGAWQGASVPVILRVPRGFAVLGAFGVLGLIVLAYWVGYSRGSNAAAIGPDGSQVVLRDDRVPRVGRVIEMRSSAAGAGTHDASDVAGGGAVTDGDPRRIGLNYLILARFPRILHDEAVRLSRFLEEAGVETAVVSSDTGELFHVVGLRGFTTEEYRAGRHHGYMDQMRRLGRQWKSHNNGKGSDLSDMWWKLH